MGSISKIHWTTDACVRKCPNSPRTGSTGIKQDAAQAPGPIPGLGGNKEQEALASGETSGSVAPAKLGASGRHDKPAKSR